MILHMSDIETPVDVSNITDDPAPGDIYSYRGDMSSLHIVIRNDGNSILSLSLMYKRVDSNDNRAERVPHGYDRNSQSDFKIAYKRMGYRCVIPLDTLEPVLPARFTFRGLRVFVCSPELKLKYEGNTSGYLAVRIPDMASTSDAKEDGWCFVRGSSNIRYMQYDYMNTYLDCAGTPGHICNQYNAYARTLRMAAKLAALGEERDPSDIDYHGLPEIQEYPERMPIVRHPQAVLMTNPAVDTPQGTIATSLLHTYQACAVDRARFVTTTIVAP